MDREKSLLERLLDENDNENIFLYNDKDEAAEFIQIALIPLNEKVYVILKPVVPIEPMDEDEALVFAVEDEGDEACLVLVGDENVIDEVFEIYYDLLEKSVE